MTRLSNRQYPMMRAFTDEANDYYMDIETAQKYDQRPFRSMLIHDWIAYRPGRGFFLTKTGAAAWREFQQTEIFRLNPDMPLTSYFDPSLYGMKTTSKRKRAPRRVSTGTAA